MSEPYKPANGWEAGRFCVDDIDMASSGGLGSILRAGFWDGRGILGI
jgi:hypothetical protein